MGQAVSQRREEISKVGSLAAIELKVQMTQLLKFKALSLVSIRQGVAGKPEKCVT
jgi:hypothetical protein